MGHAHHFLSRLDRVSLQQVELSLGLYNNVPLLKYILAHAGLPEGAQRVAISLDSRNEGPFLIVTREGHFVTCLGRGMSHDTPLVRRWQLDVLATRHEELKAAMRTVDEGDDRSRTVKLFQKLCAAGPNLSREDFVDLAAVQPMIFFPLTERLAEVDQRLRLKRHEWRAYDRVRPGDHDYLEQYWNDLWTMRHLYVLLGMGEPVEYWESVPRDALAGVRESLAWHAVWHSAFPVGIAAAWNTARFGTAYTPILRHAARTTTYHARMQMAALELSAIAATHEDQFAVLSELHHVARTSPIAARNDDLHDETRVATLAQALEAFDVRVDFDVRAARRGAELVFEQHPRVAARHGWQSPFEVPVDVARVLAVNDWCGWYEEPDTDARMFDLMPSFARYRPEEFYLPARWLSEFRVTWSPEKSVEHMRSIERYFTRRAPVKSAREPGRNDACTCGSGQKYKRCCAVKPRAVEPPPVALTGPTLADGMPVRAPDAQRPDTRLPANPANNGDPENTVGTLSNAPLIHVSARPDNDVTPAGDISAA